MVTPPTAFFFSSLSSVSGVHSCTVCMCKQPCTWTSSCSTHSAGRQRNWCGKTSANAQRPLGKSTSSDWSTLLEHTVQKMRLASHHQAPFSPLIGQTVDSLSAVLCEVTRRMLDLHQLIGPHDDLVSPLSWKKNPLRNSYQNYYWWLSVWICSHVKTMVRHFGKLIWTIKLKNTCKETFSWWWVSKQIMRQLVIHFMHLFWQYWNKWKRMAAFNKCRWSLQLMVHNM